jgi:hypothetical protein
MFPKLSSRYVADEAIQAFGLSSKYSIHAESMIRRRDREPWLCDHYAFTFEGVS